MTARSQAEQGRVRLGKTFEAGFQILGIPVRVTLDVPPHIVRLENERSRVELNLEDGTVTVLPPNHRVPPADEGRSGDYGVGLMEIDNQLREARRLLVYLREHIAEHAAIDQCWAEELKRLDTYLATSGTADPEKPA